MGVGGGVNLFSGVTNKTSNQPRLPLRLTQNDGLSFSSLANSSSTPNQYSQSIYGINSLNISPSAPSVESSIGVNTAATPAAESAGIQTTKTDFFKDFPTDTAKRIAILEGLKAQGIIDYSGETIKFDGSKVPTAAGQSYGTIIEAFKTNFINKFNLIEQYFAIYNSTLDAKAIVVACMSATAFKEYDPTAAKEVTEAKLADNTVLTEAKLNSPNGIITIVYEGKTLTVKAADLKSSWDKWKAASGGSVWATFLKTFAYVKVNFKGEGTAPAASEGSKGADVTPGGNTSDGTVNLTEQSVFKHNTHQTIGTGLKNHKYQISYTKNGKVVATFFDVSGGSIHINTDEQKTLLLSLLSTSQDKKIQIVPADGDTGFPTITINFSLGAKWDGPAPSVNGDNTRAKSKIVKKDASTNKVNKSSAPNQGSNNGSGVAPAQNPTSGSKGPPPPADNDGSAKYDRKSNKVSL